MEITLSGDHKANKNSGYSFRFDSASPLKNQGFPIKHRSPASLAFQKKNIPITNKIATIDISDAFQVNASSNLEVFRGCSDLVSSVVRYAQTNKGVADSELVTLINSAPSESFHAFEKLCERLLNGITDQLNTSTAAFALTIQESILKVGGDSLRKKFDEQYAILKDEMDFRIGLVRDRECNSFGPSSDEFKIRLFKDNELFVLSADYAISNADFATLVYRIDNQINNPFSCNNLDWLESSIDAFWLEEQTINLGEQVTLPLIKSALDQLKDFDSYADECSTASELKKAIESNKELKPYLYALVEDNNAWRSLWKQVTELDAERECPFTTLYEGLGLAFIDKLNTQLKTSLRNKTDWNKYIDDIDPTNDNTHLSLWVKEVKEILSEQRKYSALYNSVFDCDNESDEPLGGTSVIQLFDTQHADFDTYYDNQHNYLMDGEVSILSTCIRLNANTLRALEGWQKSIVLQAAFCSCSENRGVKCK